MTLPERYGPWALVAGASVGLGAAIADRYASQGMNVVVLARRADELATTAEQIAKEHGVETRAVVADLGAADIWDQVDAATHDLEIGMLVYNACEGFRLPFLDDELEHHLYGLAVNTRTPMLLTYHLGRKMRARGRGSIAVCCSMGGTGGQFGRAHYAAGKAYEWILLEGLWAENRDTGVDVVAYMVGTTATPGLLRSLPQAADPEVQAKMMIQSPEACADRLLEVLDRGPVEFPSDRHEQLFFDGASRPRADRVLATVHAATAPPAKK